MLGNQKIEFILHIDLLFFVLGKKIICILLFFNRGSLETVHKRKGDK